MNMRKSNSNQNRSKNALWDKYKDTILLKIGHDIVHDAVRRLHVAFKRRTADVKKGKFKQDKRNLSEIGSYRKKAIQILDEVNYDK